MFKRLKENVANSTHILKWNSTLFFFLCWWKLKCTLILILKNVLIFFFLGGCIHILYY